MVSKNIMISIATATLLTFSGCASSSGGNLATSVNEDSIKQFQKGTVTSTTKVLIPRSKLATMTIVGAVAGAGAGAVVTKDVKGGLIGGLIGGATGAIAGAFTEAEAYKTTISSNGKRYVAYLEKQLMNSTKVEFVDDGGELTNVNVMEDINIDTLVDVIDTRHYKNGYWYYHLQKENITLKSIKKYYYLYDEVKVNFNQNYVITDIKKLRTGVVRPPQKPKVVYKDKKVEVEKVVYKVVEKPIYIETPQKPTTEKAKDSKTAKVTKEPQKPKEEPQTTQKPNEDSIW